nr:MAG TPA: hypothetical protein [Caudoviricetes sp.]
MTVEVYNQNRGIPMGAQSLTPSGGGGGGTGGASINDSQVSTVTTYSSNKIESRLAEKTGAGLSLGFNATLASETLTFVTTDETPYTLKENYDYEIDLHFPAAGTLTDTIKMVVENNNDTIQFVALTHTDPSQPITVGTMKQLMYYDAETGFRWLFKARYKTTSTGVKVFVIYPVIAKASTPDNMITGTTTQDFDVSSVSTRPVFYKRWKFRSAPDVYQQVRVYQGGIVFDDLCAKTLVVNPTINSYGAISDGIKLEYPGAYGKISTPGSSSKKLVLTGGSGYLLVLGSGIPKIGYSNYPSTSTLYPILTSFNTKAGDGVSITTDGDNVTISATGGTASVSDNGIRGDYESRYGIIESPNGILTDAQDSENNLVLTLHQGLVMQCAGQDAKTIVSADTTHTVESTTEFDLFYAGGAFYEAAEVVFSETEPVGSDTGITAWFNPNKTANPDQKWQFKSNANGNTWASSAAGRIAHIHTNGTAITRIDYAGCRILDGQHFLSAAEAAHAAMPSKTKYTALTPGESGTTYTAPADGFVQVMGKSATVGGYVEILNGLIDFTFQAAVAQQYTRGFCLVGKNDVFTVNHAQFEFDALRFVYAIGSEPTT